MRQPSTATIFRPFMVESAILKNASFLLILSSPNGDVQWVRDEGARK